jgi:hypothetical protein
MGKDIAKRTLLVAVSLAFACLVTEATFRVAGRLQGIDYRLYLKELKNSDRLPRALFLPDPVLGTVLAPNKQELAVTSDFSVVYRTNSKGLRDREYEYEKTPGKLRVLALGDSFTFGEGVPYGERFADLPEQQLDGVEILNTGVPGWGTEAELLYLAREGLRYRPDVVVLFLNYVDLTRQRPNLFRDGRIELPTDAVSASREEPPAAGGEGPTWYLKADDPLFRERGLLVRHSYALSYLSFRLALWQRRDALEQQDAGAWQKKSAGKQSADLSAGTRIPTAPERTMLVLRKFVELSKAEGFRLVMVNISCWAHLDFVAGVDPGLAYHDLAPLLIAESKNRSLLFQYDKHYNPQTHALIGQQLTEILRPLVKEHADGLR